jgi:hypothetical protein
MLVIETAFSNHESALAQRSQHLAPHTLAQELAQKHIENAEEALLNSLRQEKGISFGDK